MPEVITSRDNAQVKLAAGLAARKKERDASGLFVAEGYRLCLDAVDSGVAVRTLLLTERASRLWPETEKISHVAARTLLVGEEIAAKISDTKSPQGVFAICEKLDNRRCAVTIRSGGHYLLLAGLQDPGNLGTILRTADAVGICGVFLSADSPDIYSPKVLRGAMGGLFRLPVSVGGDLSEEIAELRAHGIPVWAAALTEQSTRAGTLDFAGGGAVLIGNEGNGLPDHLVRACSGSVTIPMTEGANSLNAAMAAGILMWEMRRNNDGGAGSEN